MNLLTLIGLKSRRKRTAEARKVLRRAVLRRIGNYPIKEMTQREFEALMKSESVPRGFTDSCEIGTWFVCWKTWSFSDIIIIGQIVSAKDVFPAQITGGAFSSERGVNRYRVKII